MLRESQGGGAVGVKYHVRNFLSRRASLLISLMINFLCGLALTAVTGYATFLITFSAFQSQSKADRQSANVYLGWTVLFAIGLFLVYIALYGMHGNRKVGRMVNMRHTAFVYAMTKPLVMILSFHLHSWLADEY